MLELNFTPFPVLETKRLILRKPEMGDATAMFKMRSNPDVMSQIARPIAKTLEDAEKLIQVFEDRNNENLGITWAITLKGKNEMIGTMGFWRIEAENHRAEIGYMLSPDYWRQGIMHEAIEICLEYAFKTLNFNSIEGHTSPENIASQSTLRKAGFVKEAHFRENLYFEGGYRDSVVFALLASDYKALNSPLN